jgi:hypothetical protein
MTYLSPTFCFNQQDREWKRVLQFDEYKFYKRFLSDCGYLTGIDMHLLLMHTNYYIVNHTTDYTMFHCINLHTDHRKIFEIKVADLEEILCNDTIMNRQT